MRALLLLLLTLPAFCGTRTTKPPSGAAIDVANGIANGLVHFWAALEGSGTATSEIIGSHPMTLNAGATWTTGQDGVSKAISFSGSSGAEVVSNSAWALNTSDANVMSMCALINTSATASRRSIYGVNNTTGLMTLEINTNSWPGSMGTTTFGVYVAVTGNTINPLTTGTWNLVCYTRSGSGATHVVYKNGSTVTLGQNGSDSYSNSSATRIIGARAVGSQNFAGKIEWLGYWNRTLSSTEITSINTNTIYQVFADSAPSAKVRRRVIQ